MSKNNAFVGFGLTLVAGLLFIISLAILEYKLEDYTAKVLMLVSLLLTMVYGLARMGYLAKEMGAVNIDQGKTKLVNLFIAAASALAALLSFVAFCLMCKTIADMERFNEDSLLQFRLSNRFYASFVLNIIAGLACAGSAIFGFLDSRA